MIKVFGYLKRKPGLSPQEFADYYEHNHVPLVLSKAFMPMVYKRNYIQRGDAFNIEGDEISFDCMTGTTCPPGWPVLASMRFPETKRTSSIGPQRELTWWTSAPPRAEPRAFNAIRAEHPCHRSRGSQVRRWPPSGNRVETGEIIVKTA